MQNFKLFFKILNRYKGQMIMFVGIFASVIISVTKSNSASGDATSYMSRTVQYALFDEDQSVLSGAIAAYLAESQELVENIPNEKRALQDAIYNGDIDCSLVIPAGFGDALLAGDGQEDLQIVTYADSQEAVLFETALDNYINILANYLQLGYDAENAVIQANRVMDLTVDVTFPDGGEVKDFNPAHFFFIYLAWVMIMIIVNGVGPVLSAFKEKECSRRIYCSSCKFSSLQGSMYAGMAVLGTVLTIFFAVLGSIIVGKNVSLNRILLYGVNLLCYTVVALSLVFLFSAITRKQAVLSMLANVVSLGMSFICGIFVPMELLSDGVEKAAHFLPAYWYGQAVELADKGLMGKEFMGCLGIELLFAVAIFVVAAVVNRKNA
ncbi:MAG: ABC transporter permease [Lachnospiraceae bacterium]|nr:ABC transporter permease [Lachnospiraceae bacterium]